MAGLAPPETCRAAPRDPCPAPRRYLRLLGGVRQPSRLVALGVLIVIVGLAWPWLRRIPLFRLPGDVVIDRPGFRLFLPFTTMIVVSLLASLILWLLRK